MILSHTQLASYLRCPRSFRYRYLDGYREKETRAAMVFGRCFEKALAALFRQEDPGATLYQEWAFFRDASLDYKNGESWDRLIHQGVHLLERFVQGNRVRIRAPQHDLQVKMTRLAGGHEFVAYLDAIVANSTANDALSTGRRPRADIPRIRMACCRLILS